MNKIDWRSGDVLGIKSGAAGRGGSEAFNHSTAGRVQAAPPATPVPPTPEATATSTPIGFIPNFFVTYEHTSPGSYSTVLVFVFEAEPGTEITGQVTGPAVDGDGNVTAVADEEGNATAMVRIFQFGTYTVSVPEYDYVQEVPVGPGPPTATPES